MCLDIDWHSVLGFGMRLLGIPAAPLLLALVLGNLLEQAMRQALTLSDGNPAIFVQSPISLTLLILAALSLAYPVWRKVRQARGERSAA